MIKDSCCDVKFIFIDDVLIVADKLSLMEIRLHFGTSSGKAVWVYAWCTNVLLEIANCPLHWIRINWTCAVVKRLGLRNLRRLQQLWTPSWEQKMLDRGKLWARFTWGVEPAVGASSPRSLREFTVEREALGLCRHVPCTAVWLVQNLWLSSQASLYLA